MLVEVWERGGGVLLCHLKREAGTIATPPIERQHLSASLLRELGMVFHAASADLL
jgi:hypothetical protein